MQSRLEEIRALGAEVLALSADTPQENHKLAESAGLEFSLLSDQQGTALDAFGVRHASGSIDGGDIARPGIFIVGRDGNIVWRFLTDNWRVRVRPETIIRQLKALQ